jgi:hypothetical protein
VPLHVKSPKAADTQTFTRVEVGGVYRRHRDAWDHLALPPGWAFVLGADGYRDVYAHEEEDDGGTA